MRHEPIVGEAFVANGYVVALVASGGEHGGLNFLMRAFVRFQRNPSSVRHASAAIISTIVVPVPLGAALMRLFDSEQYPTFGAAVWFTLRTVTTVGHGDDTPTSFVGRFVASGVMLVSISLFTVVTAGITSILIGAVSREEEVTDRRTSTETLARIEASLAATHQ